MTHLKRSWCWERLRAVGEGDDRGWDGWMASPTQWTWVWASSGSWWRTGKPGVLQSMGLQRVRHDWATELNWIDWKFESCPWALLYLPSIQDHFFGRVLNLLQARWLLKGTKKTSLPGPESHCEHKLSPTHLSLPCIDLSKAYVMSESNLGLEPHRWTDDYQNPIGKKWNLWEDILTVYSSTVLVPNLFVSHGLFWKRNAFTQVLLLGNFRHAQT